MNCQRLHELPLASASGFRKALRTLASSQILWREGDKGIALKSFGSSPLFFVNQVHELKLAATDKPICQHNLSQGFIFRVAEVLSSAAKHLAANQRRLRNVHINHAQDAAPRADVCVRPSGGMRPCGGLQ
jgi:hypothetical protein